MDVCDEPPFILLLARRMIQLPLRGDDGDCRGPRCGLQSPLFEDAFAPGCHTDMEVIKPLVSCGVRAPAHGTTAVQVRTRGRLWPVCGMVILSRAFECCGRTLLSAVGGCV